MTDDERREEERKANFQVLEACQWLHDERERKRLNPPTFGERNRSNGASGFRVAKP